MPTCFHISCSALQISKIWVHIKVTFTPCWKHNQQQGRTNHLYNSSEQHPAVCLPHWPGESSGKEMGTLEQPKAAKSETDQSLGVGIIKHLGLGLQVMRENKWVLCFFPPLAHFPSCLILVTASQNSLRSRRQLPKPGPEVFSHTIFTREALLLLSHLF